MELLVYILIYIIIGLLIELLIVEHIIRLNKVPFNYSVAYGLFWMPIVILATIVFLYEKRKRE